VFIVEKHIRRVGPADETAVAKAYVTDEAVKAEVDDLSGPIED
jgi:hypothetical protein